MKKCSKCKQPLPDSAYSNCRSAKDRLNHKCDECNREVAKTHYEKTHGTSEERKAKQKLLLDYIKSLKQQKWTLKDIAEATGLDESTISYYLSGKRRVGTQAVRKFEERRNL
jgi:predicted transcriptional regulator